MNLCAHMSDYVIIEHASHARLIQLARLSVSSMIDGANISDGYKSVQRNVLNITSVALQ